MTAEVSLNGLVSAVFADFAASRPPTVTVRKQADEIVNNSTTLQDDDELFFEILPEVEAVGEFILFVNGNGAADFKWQLTGPAGMVGQCASHAARLSDDLLQTTPGNGSIGDTRTVGIGGSAGGLIRIPFSLLNGDTGGFVRLRWAQATADASNTTVKLGSYLIAREVVPPVPLG